MKFIILFVVAGLSSCCGLHTEVDYRYSDITIKRVDECGKTTFYYYNRQKQNKGIIWVEYSGINDGFKGYLVFSDNGKVVLLSGDGYFKTKNIDTSFFEYKRIIAIDRPQNRDNVYMIMLSTRYEKEFNDKHKTKIGATYRIDKNEWW